MCRRLGRPAIPYAIGWSTPDVTTSPESSPELRAAPVSAPARPATRSAETCVARETRATCQLEAPTGIERETRGDLLGHHTTPPHPSPLRRCFTCFRAPVTLPPAASV